MSALTSGAWRAVGRLAAVRRRSALRGARFAACVALVGGAVVLRGSAGALLVLLALLIVVDSLVPIPGQRWSEADDRFQHLIRERRHDDARRRLRRAPPERLDVLDDGTGWASRAERESLGVRSIPIDSVTGTVEPLKARTFDRRFRPDRSAGEHWKRLWLAHARGAPLPPISVYRIGATHVVRDGHHRVSVARDQGCTTIDAEVVALHRPRRA